MESFNIWYVKEQGYLPDYLFDYMDMLDALQHIHDNVAVDRWREFLQNYAKDNGLKFPF